MKPQANPEMIDEENPEWTDGDFSRAVSGREFFAKLGLPVPVLRENVALPVDVVAAYRATGNEWQAKMEAVLRDWLRDHAVNATRLGA